MHVRLRLGAESYAFGVEHVLEVAELGNIAPLPGAPAGVLGVRNLRGQLLPVFELGSLLGIPRDAPPQRLLVAEHEGRLAGFAIDEVIDVMVLTAPTDRAESPLLRGAVLDEGELIGVVDVPRLFSTLTQADA